MFTQSKVRNQATRKRGRKVRTQETAEIRNCGSPMTKKARQHSSKQPDGLDQGWGGGGGVGGREDNRTQVTYISEITQGSKDRKYKTIKIKQEMK